ncbi:hypothetical protein Trydic_g4430 [Trypoxylus dichotomus]
MLRLRQHRNDGQLSEFDRGLIVGLRESGFSLKEVKNLLHRNQSTIKSCYQPWIMNGQESRRRDSDGRRGTSRAQDRHLQLLFYS